MGPAYQAPKAPSWSFVFGFAAVWNAVIERCWWATAFCLALLAGSLLIARRQQGART